MTVWAKGPTAPTKQNPSNFAPDFSSTESNFNQYHHHHLDYDHTIEAGHPLEEQQHHFELVIAANGVIMMKTC